MATVAFSLSAAPRYPLGTTISAYQKRFFPGPQPVDGQAPNGAPLATTALVSALGVASLEGLLAETEYYAAGEVSGTWVWTGFTTGKPPAGGGGGEILPITSEELGLEAVTTPKIANEAVTAGKIGSEAVTGGKILTEAVSAGKLAANAVTTPKLASEAVSEAKLAALAVSAAKLAAEAVETGKIKNLAVTEPKLGAEAVSNSKILKETIGRDRLAPSLQAEVGIVTETVHAANATTSETTLPATTVAQINVITLKANTKIVLPSTTAGTSVTLYLVQDATGSRTVTWEAPGGNVRWEEGVLPTLSTGANAVDAFSFVCVVAGKWDGVFAAKELK